MSPLNRGPLLGPRMPPAGMRPPPPRFGGRLPPPGMPPRMPPPISAMFGPMRQRMLPPRPGPPRPGPPPLFGPRGRGLPPLMPPMMVPRGMGPRGPLMRPGPRGIPPPQGLPHMRPRFPPGAVNPKAKAINNAKKVSKLEELELKKPWMTDEIRSEIQKKNKLYAKAKKNKDAKEWEEFKDLRNKVTRMIRDAKNEYLAKHPEQAHLYNEEDELYDIRDENYTSNEEEEIEVEEHYCEVCDREFTTKDMLARHKAEHRVCGIDGCIFAAHPKLIEKHISMQHYTGLYEKIKNLSTPEDVQKWIAERKKRYPTRANVELRKAEEAEKVCRGEIIRRERALRQEKPGKVSKERKRKCRKRVERVKEVADCSQVQLYRGLVCFPGTEVLRDPQLLGDEMIPEETKVVETEEEENSKISDDEETVVPIIKTERCIGLVADYGSDSNEDEPPDEVPIKKLKQESPEPEATPSVETQIYKKPEETKKTYQSNKRKTTEIPQNNKKRQPYRTQLLNRLLSRSIQHERNLVCQCIKYIVENNFFE
ncbi:nuclear fragile X mental retardation-interacting protein 1 [Cephus cinctus]|uniref:Nuclear fragile X mental retardation-interacting protein 1 n=1 Tax=Cephus cinctus TaxID=211228 RepID=A0AAJ7FL08_CEPCN|nr:nuclear fragile X mental retardation-interacting protein 1 [Cephus cinctus]